MCADCRKRVTGVRWTGWSHWNSEEEMLSAALLTTQEREKKTREEWN